MSEEKTNNGIENKVKSLEERINALEIKLEIEREDLDKLEEVSYLMKDNNPANLEKFLKTGVCKDYSAPSDESCREQTKPFIDSSKQYFPVSNTFLYHANNALNSYRKRKRRKMRKEILFHQRPHQQLGKSQI